MIRVATLADLAALSELERSCFGREDAEDALAAELSRAWSHIFVEELEGALTGFVNVWRVGDEVEVLYVATAPARRRTGVASRLMGHVIARCAREGTTRVLLEVRPSNDAAIALYRRFDFEVVGLRKGYYDDGEDALLMAVAL